MRYRWARWSLAVAAFAAAAGACSWALQLDGRLRATRQTAAIAVMHAGNARAALSEVRRAVAAMASPGQAAVGWSRRASAGIEEARTQMTALTAVVPAAAAPRASIDVLERLAEAERRLRDHAVGGKPLMAADVAFAEATPHLDTLERQIADSLSAATAGADAEVAALRDRQAAALAAALAALAIAVLVLAPLPRPLASAAEAVAPEPDTGAAPVPDVPGVLAAQPGWPTAAMPAAPTLDLASLAAICGELSAVADAQVLSGLLARAGAAIGARGVMLWLADEQRQTLRIAATAGYDVRLTDRIGPVDVGDDNPTARAFATGHAVVTDARDGRAAAAAVPVTGAAGVRGVLSAELDATAPTEVAAASAALRIIAAQLATLVGSTADPAPIADVQAQG